MSDDFWIAWKEAIIHRRRPHVVMGRRLVFLTLRHQFWLDHVKSPFVRGGEPTAMDLELATRICSVPAHRIQDALARPPAPWTAFFHSWIWRGRRLNLEMLRFSAYIKDYSSGPEMLPGSAPKVHGSQTDRTKFPSMMGLILQLVKGNIYGGDIDRIWGMSPGEAAWASIGLALMEGQKIPLATPQDLESLELLRIFRERGGKKPTARRPPPHPALLQRRGVPIRRPL
jgi:hypothetical protein